MSIAEMKQEAINGISKLNDEVALKEILEHLSRLSSKEDEEPIALSQHYNAAKEQYGEVLAKLAQ